MKKPYSPTSMYSPTKINTFYRCPRLYYYRYVLRIPLETNIHLYKGNTVHKVIEDSFKMANPKGLKQDLLARFKSEWNLELAGVVLPKEDADRHKQECEYMLEIFADAFLQKLKLVMLDTRIKSLNQAWNTLKPRLAEHRIVNKELKLQGIIDSIEKDFDGNIFIIDYKTSKKHKNVVTEEYARQVSLYALLYLEENKQLPTYVGLNYLRYGETMLFPVTDQMIEEARASLEFVKTNTQSTDIKDYPLTGNKWAVAECKEIAKTLKEQKK